MGRGPDDEGHMGNAAADSAPPGDTCPPEPGRRRRVTAACACILGNETAERLAYYGMQTNLSLYAKQYLGYPAAIATSKLQAWKATVYVTPLLGAFLADAYMGRFWVILVFSVIYLAGLAGITGVNAQPSIKPRFMEPPANGSFEPTRSMFWGFMYLIALGSGGIKACVASFGGDQFREGSAVERGWRSSFFNWFYFAINVGSLVAALVVVPMQESRGYAIGFAIPTALMGCAIVLLITGALFKIYTYVPPEGSPFFRILQVLRWAFVNRRQPIPTHPDDECYEPLVGEVSQKFKMGHTNRMRYLERAALPHGQSGAYQVSLSEVEELKALAGLAPVFLCVCIWQMCYDPIFSLLPYPGDVMERSIGTSGLKLPAASISFANTFGVLISVPLYDLVLVPFAKRIGRPISYMARIGAGFVVLIIALLTAGFIELARYRMVRRMGLAAKWEVAVAADPAVEYTDPAFTEPISIWWQTIPYFLVGAAETLTLVGVLDLFFTQVSEGMRALSTAIQLLTTAVGTYLASALNIAIAAGTRADPWVADNPLYGHYDWYFFVNAAILALGLIAFVLVARFYEEKAVIPHDDLLEGGAIEMGCGPSSSIQLPGGQLRARHGPKGTPGSPSSSSPHGLAPARSSVQALQVQALDPL